MAAAVFNGILFTACNGGGVTRADFIQKADAICREAERKAERLGKPRSIDRLDDFVADAEDITRDMLHDVRQLERPAEDRETIGSLLEEIEAVVDYLPKVADAYEARDQGRVEAIGQKLQSTAARASDMAEDYGLEVCGRIVESGATS